jgi:regulator of replication initiation timing
MPTLPQEQIIEIELEIQDLLEQLEDLDAIKIENEVLRAENLRLRERLKTD